jgi:hypothetical protein
MKAYHPTRITLASLLVTFCLFYLFHPHPHKHFPNPLSLISRSSSFDIAALLSFNPTDYNNVTNSFANNATRIYDNIGDVRNETLGVGLHGI